MVGCNDTALFGVNIHSNHLSRQYKSLKVSAAPINSNPTYSHCSQLYFDKDSPIESVWDVSCPAETILLWQPVQKFPQ